MLDSNNVDGAMAHPDALEDEGKEHNKNVIKAPDLHTMLAKILESYTPLQQSGFKWDLCYKKKWCNIEFVLCTPFFKVDGDEAEKLCGKHTSRTASVACLCRYCVCPTDKSDDPNADYPHKTKPVILGLTLDKDFDKLKAMSQQCIDNATCAIRFGAQNSRSIHGACPMEMLHATLLGMFRCIRDCFFEQLGAGSKLATLINGFAQELGGLMSRQSDRNLPKTRFGQGICEGKLMAKEHPGILSCSSAVLRFTKGNDLLRRKRPKMFGTEEQRKDWRMLVETLLEWEDWLKSDEIHRNYLELARYKHRYLMYIMKKVGKRAAGMKLKISKFHQIVHMIDDMFQNGVPMEFDTGANESGHKPTKVAARLTQKKEETFDQQTAKRLEEVHLLELAELEMAGRPLWNYGLHPPDRKEISHQPRPPVLGGSKIQPFWDQGTRRFRAAETSRSKRGTPIKLEKDLVDFVGNLQRKLAKHGVENVTMRTEHARDGQIFRASPRFRDHVWRDWVIVDWGDEGELPNEIWGFLDLRERRVPVLGGSKLVVL